MLLAQVMSPSSLLSGDAMLNFWTAVGFVITAAVVFVVVALVMRLGRDPIRERLARSTAEPFMSGEVEPRPSAWAESLAAQLPEVKIDNGVLDRDLRKAGLYKPTARAEYLAIRNGLTIGAIIITAVLAAVVGPDHEVAVVRIVAGGVAAALLCWAMPRIMLRMRGARRQLRIERSFPDALDMTSMSLSGGLSLPDALAYVSHEIYVAHPDLAVELLIVRQQANMISLDYAFNQFARRIDAPEILTMSALVAQAQRLGTDMVSSIRDYADSMRLKRRQTADERASKAGVKLLFPLVLCMLPSVFIILWGPAALQLYNFFTTFQGAEPIDDIFN